MADEDREVQNEVKSFIDRIRRMKAERKAIDVDIREIYGEAKSRGFDKTILGKAVNYVEKREEDPNAVAESEAILDLYIGAYYGAGTVVANAHTHETKKSEPQPSKAAGQQHDDHVAGDRDEAPRIPVADIPAVAEGLRSALGTDVGDGGEAIQPETAEPSTEGVNDPELQVADGANIGGDDEVPAHSESVILDRRLQKPVAPQLGQNGDEHQHTEHPETNTAPAGRVADESPASNISAFKPKPLRPNCLKPEACAGSGRNHCWQCTKAMNEAGSAA